MKLYVEKYISPRTERRLVPNPDKPGKRHYVNVVLEEGRMERTLLWDFKDGPLRLEGDNAHAMDLIGRGTDGGLKVLGVTGCLEIRPEASNVVTLVTTNTFGRRA